MIKILLVEDSTDDAMLLGHVLKHQGLEHELMRVDSAPALDQALAQQPWEIVLTDYNLPKFSGLEVIQQVARHNPDTPVIVISGAVGEEMAATLMRAGAKDFIRKDNMARLIPAIERELKEAVERRARRKAEQREQEAVAEVRAAKELDRLKNLFVNTISHELRTPLTAILGFVEFLEDGVESPAVHQEYTQGILKNTRRLQRLVDDLLDHARFEAGTFTLQCHEAEFQPVVVEVLDSLKPPAAAADVTIALSMPAAPLQLELDAQRIEQVLTNLVSNAIKFSPAGATVSVRVTREGEALRCEIEDQGAGIAAEDLPRLFQLFSQLDEGRAKGGTGLGLAIAKNLVEAHGGTIGVLCPEGKGCTFWFTLPLARRQSRI